MAIKNLQRVGEIFGQAISKVPAISCLPEKIDIIIMRALEAELKAQELQEITGDGERCDFHLTLLTQHSTKAKKDDEVNFTPFNKQCGFKKRKDRY